MSVAQVAAQEKLVKQRTKLELLTQFRKKNCHPLNVHCHPKLKTLKRVGTEDDTKSFEQIARETANRLCRQNSFLGKTQLISEEELHPSYTDENDKAFIKEMYRLKGFAYLRNQQKLI